MCNLDKAQELIEFNETVIIDNARSALQNRKYPPKGICYNCSDIVGEDQVYCDADCAEDHLKRVNLKRGKRV